MLSESLLQSAAKDKESRMEAGERVIINDQILDYIDRNDVASCRNRQQCGTLDQYVAWIGEKNKPKDLEFRDGYAIGSK